ncbi:fido domain-containing protein [Xylaria arbuscula]|nr:fido domain-containing protein [Xylaria arbuscula]
MAPSPFKKKNALPLLNFTGDQGNPQDIYKSATASESKMSGPIVSSATKSQAIRYTISKAWPPFRVSAEPLNLTITMCDIYRTQVQDEDPNKLFAKAQKCLMDISDCPPSEAATDIIEKQLKHNMIRVIFGGNMIERVGLGLDETWKLCERIFAGEDVDNIDERTPDYMAKLAECHKNTPGSDFKTMPIKGFIRGRREVVQHAKAFQLMMYWVVSLDIPISEQLIRNVHYILCKGTPIVGGNDTLTPWEEYAGRYRKVHVGAGTTMFTPPKFVEKQMKELVDDLNAELNKAREEEKLDPFAFAAKYSMRFVQIHPFQDGNGRICRILLNVLLCKFAGIVVPIGETEEDRDEYIRIKKTSSEEAEDHGEYATFVLSKCETRLRALKKKLTALVKNN